MGTDKKRGRYGSGKEQQRERQRRGGGGREKKREREYGVCVYVVRELAIPGEKM